MSQALTPPMKKREGLARDVIHGVSGDDCQMTFGTCSRGSQPRHSRKRRTMDNRGVEPFSSLCHSRTRVALVRAAAALLMSGIGTFRGAWAQAEVSKPVRAVVVDIDLRKLPVSTGWKPGAAVVERPLRVDPGYVPSGGMGHGDELWPWQSGVRVLNPQTGLALPYPNFEGMSYTGFRPPD